MTTNQYGYPSRQQGRTREQEIFTRARFEKWYKETYWDFGARGWDEGENSYHQLDVQLAWAAYQEGIQILRVRHDAPGAEEMRVQHGQLHVQYGKLLDKYRAKRSEVEEYKALARAHRARACHLEKQLDEEKKRDVYTVAAQNIVLAANLASANRALHAAAEEAALWKTRAQFLQSAVATARDALENV